MSFVLLELWKFPLSVGLAIMTAAVPVGQLAHVVSVDALEGFSASPEPRGWFSFQLFSVHPLFHPQ